MGYTFCLGVGVLQTSFGFNGNTVITPVFQAKFGWTDDETIFNNTLISTSSIIGMMVGSLVGGKTITIGRRKAAIYVEILAIVGAGISLVRTVPTICLGRFLYSVTAGHTNIIMGKSIDETLPSELSGKFGTFLNTYICVGVMGCFFLGALLPTDEADYVNDEMWRVIYAFPILIAIIQITLFLFIFKEEPIAYSIAMGRDDEAKRLMRRVYKKSD